MFSFFFFKQKTAYEMRISDWSSDVCSSDLVATRGQALLNRYWGGYVALTIGDDATLSVVRDPSGMMPCYVRRTPDGAILASDMPALAERGQVDVDHGRSEEHTSELQSLMRISYAVFCLKNQTHNTQHHKP